MNGGGYSAGPLFFPAMRASKVSENIIQYRSWHAIFCRARRRMQRPQFFFRVLLAPGQISIHTSVVPGRGDYCMNVIVREEPVSERGRIMNRRTYSTRGNECAPRSSEYRKQCQTALCACPAAVGCPYVEIGGSKGPELDIYFHHSLQAKRIGRFRCPLSEIHFRLIDNAHRMEVGTDVISFSICA